MPNPPALPRGIRTNNPGNLRSAVGPSRPGHLDNGYWVFPSMHDGLTSFFELVWNYYVHLSRKNVTDFLAHYAPASENDLYAYRKFVCERLGIPFYEARTYDLGLNRGWPAVQFARAIFAFENGRPPRTHPNYPEWIDVNSLATAIKQTGHWEPVSP